MKIRRLLKRSYLLYIPLAVFLFFSFVYTFFIMNALSQNKADDQFKETIDNLRAQIESLENKAKLNENNLKDLNQVYSEFLENKQNLLNKLQKPKNVPHAPPTQVDNIVDGRGGGEGGNGDLNQCEWLKRDALLSSVQMFDVYNQRTFDDVDGGVWKQGWTLQYDESRWNSNNKLNVIVTPHSHNDPGWLMTFEEYFNLKTKHILDAIVNSLSVKRTRKFVWAEISYLSMWWTQASDLMRAKLKSLLANGQLEIVTGGWVMNDEANTHYFSMIEQMVEGHQWLNANIGPDVNITNGWSIDPFGYTPTMAYILKKTGFQHMVIQRVHYNIKKFLAQSKSLEFYWKQLWDRDNTSGIFTHVMPFYSYDVPHTCGPDPKVCCQFDFRRTDRDIGCPWGVNPVIINEKNVEERAALLLDQYRKKSELFNHNTVFIQLGDDFRYTSMDEANKQFENYERLMDYMNSRTDWNVNIKFGTLKDYFELVGQDRTLTKQFGSLNGDFFTYADRQDHYWSGYFTSRPLYKRLDRLVEYYLRTAEILFSYFNVLNTDVQFKNGLYKKLLESRRNLGLFQHHDGITGTAKTAVVNDYGAKLLKSIHNSQHVIQKSVEYFVTQKTPNPSENLFVIDDERLNAESLATKKLLVLDAQHTEANIFLFNPSEHKRADVLVSVYVNTQQFEIVDETSGQAIEAYQFNYVWTKEQSYTAYLEHSQDTWECVFNVKHINQFEIRKLRFSLNTAVKSVNEHMSQMKFYLPSKAPHIDKINSKVSYEMLDERDEGVLNVKLFESQYEAVVSKQTGLLQEIYDFKVKTSFKSQIKFKYYGVTNSREKSGAYLFLPDSATPTELNYALKWYRVEQGPLRTRICTHLVYIVNCIEFTSSHYTTTTQTSPQYAIWNLVDIKLTNNFEFIMNLNTNVQNSEREFYTDLNGFQYIKRKTHDKLPIQANVYPMPSMVYIQDAQYRLSVLSSQPLGVDCLRQSEIEVFLDRRLNQDDNRGLEQAILDNQLTSSRFMVMFEKVNEGVNKNGLYPSLNVQLAVFNLLNPIVRLFYTSPATASLSKVFNLIPAEYTLPCDLRVINMRTLARNCE